MASSIDATKPVTGSPTTSSVRSNFSAAESEINAPQVISPVAFGHIVSDGSGSQDVSDCVGVTSCTISGTTFLIVLSAAVASTTSMVVVGTGNFGIASSTISVDQTSTTEFTLVWAVASTGVAAITSGLDFNFIVMDAG